MAQSVPLLGWFERTTPAKLSRSSLCMWLLLVLAGVLLSSTYLQDRMATARLQSQAVPAATAGLNLLTDFRVLQSSLVTELDTVDPIARARDQSAYQAAHDKTVGDIESATRITAPTWLPGSGSDLSLTQSQGMLKQTFRSFDQSVSAAREALSKGDAETVKLELNSAKRTLGELLYPAAFDIYTYGLTQTAFQLDQAAARNVTLLRAGYVIGALLIALIVWQYAFMLLNCRIIVQLTAVTLLLVAVVFGYAYVGVREVDRHLLQVRQGVERLAAPGQLLNVNVSSETAGQQMIKFEHLPQLSAASERSTAEAASIDQELRKAQDRVQFLPGAFFILLIAGLFYKFAVVRALRDYR